MYKSRGLFFVMGKKLKTLIHFSRWIRPSTIHRASLLPSYKTLNMEVDRNLKSQIIQSPQKRQWNETRLGENFGGQKKKKIKKIKKANGKDDVLMHDIIALLRAQKLGENTKSGSQNAHEDTPASLAQVSLPEPFTEIEIEVKEISSTGDGLALHPDSGHVYVVPFSVPGDIIRVKVIKHYVDEKYSTADIVSIVKKGPLRDDSLINCKYFTICSGCQFQMLDYNTQLALKRKVIEKAYKNFSQLPDHMLHDVGETIGSPLQYGYRTKLTPHFDAPKGYISKADKLKGVRNHFKEIPKIGFNAKGGNYTLDIEDCPIGTDAIRMGMKKQRLRVAEELGKYTKGATILLRESTQRLPNNEANLTSTIPDTVKTISPHYIDFKSCVTDNKAITTEYIDDFVFTNIANEFFQNNNSILPRFTQYIRDNILSPVTAQGEIKNLIDAYSGSGLFTITLSSLFENSVGIDISTSSINCAKENARGNNLAPSKAKFIAADASMLFKEVTFNPDETVVVLDPSRKGCDESFIHQLLDFGPRRIVYVSCNVHTQARDVGKIINGLEDEKDKETKLGGKYEIESLRGFDFFPQTSHVESIAILNRVPNQSTGTDSETRVVNMVEA